MLLREGRKVTEKTVGRIMRQKGICSRIMKKFRVNTTDSNHSLPVAPNVLN
ncbi:hypothetical protein ACOALA_08025 [Alicyclobacillus acidoterrestris]|uniref:hypothetical protein n=1 Tax=Alicyclobacillus acidoterrestris TaxID=1450 RepID=UPI003F53242F